ncbi:GerAB/ArcD/ProY family transporter [Salinibacillus xinjiangensis]|uniref:GerAB/ArcD/ProY family transporter n=1 Tax=Salinibacillus xinjiangensis TaxID=1229268 RepID=A0A6G1X8I7_9BACI|nr:endospore germination permease [Salinibacillus xinjiangensis]MRG87118.1 GerAB/ArcD/ProY family transporter [Salinibacillus xinjiangensis]
MIEKGKIGVRQFTVLVLMYTLGTAVIILPSLTASYAHANAWITMVIAMLIGIGIVFMLNCVISIDWKKNLFELSEHILGKWVGKAVSVLFLTYILLLTATNLRQIGEFITTQVTVETPIQFVMFIFMMTSLIGVRLGLEVIGRTSEIFFPYAFTSLILLLILVAPEADFRNVQPVLQEDIGGTFLAVIPTLTTPYLELFIFLAIFPYVHRFKPAKKAFYIGVIIGSVILTLITLMCLAVLGPDFTARQIFPSYILGKKISLANFLERIEILVAIAWFFTIFFKITLNFYVLNLGMSHFFNLKSTKTLSTPLAFIIIIMGIILFTDIIYYNEFVAYYAPYYSATIGILLPMLLLLVGFIRKKKKKSKVG